MMSIKKWPQEDRPREKLLVKGEQHLTDAELITICLRTGKRGKSALDVAKELLVEYGTLKKLLLATQADLVKCKKIGKAQYATLKAAIELGRRYLSDQLTIGMAINTNQLVRTFLVERMKEYMSEVIACLFLDSRLRVIHFEELFHGTVNETSVYPREIIRRGLCHNAANIILVHNHPSGQTEPSQADQIATRVIKQSLAFVDIRLIDHIIIGHNFYFSFSENGLL